MKIYENENFSKLKKYESFVVDFECSNLQVTLNSKTLFIKPKQYQKLLFM